MDRSPQYGFGVALLDRIRTGTYLADGEPLAVPGRLVSLADTAVHIREGQPALFGVRDFLDQVDRRSAAELFELVSERPEPTGDRRADALLGGIAEYLSVTRGFACPGWAQEPERFLDRFWFVSEVPGFRATAIVQTPVSLKRRGIFWPERSLHRV